MMKQVNDIKGTILRNEAIVPGYYLASIRLSIPMSSVKPGQFIMIKVPSYEVFLRRPFSIYEYDDGVLSILYKVAGKGTAALASAAQEREVMVLGPLGNGFSILPGHKPVIVAGGIGLAGVRLLWLSMQDQASLFWGCTNEAESALLSGFLSGRPQVSTIDGSLGCRGNVIDLLSQQLPQLQRPVQVFACGPEAMFVSLRELLHTESIPCQVLTEERMACGFGICFGCVKKTLDEVEPYKRVCKEGPVFDLWQICL
jgi:dihydroorotate dehydrogenase electron transfer subunit